jgi:hypothetical protein
LDTETALVWEKAPTDATMTWGNAILTCYRLKEGGRMGWRLPTPEELTSLVDPTQSRPALPLNHPFLNVKFDIAYWSASTDPITPDTIWVVHFGPGELAADLTESIEEILG